MIEFYKEKLTFYRLLLTFTMTAISGCAAWFFINYLTCTVLQTIVNLTAILCLTVFGIKTVMSIKFCLNKIGELK